MKKSQTSSATDALSSLNRSNTNPSQVSSRARSTEVYANQGDEANLALETFINGLQLNTFFQLTEDAQEERMAKIDVLELYDALQEVNRELAMSRLESHYLYDFLNKNDAKLLIGLQQRRATTPSQKLVRAKDATQSLSSTQAIRNRISSFSMSRSYVTTTTGSSQRKPAVEYKLNFKAKAEMAEKLAMEVEKRVLAMESAVLSQVKILRGHMEELQFMYQETQETAHNFKLHFLRDPKDMEFLQTATEKQLERKLKKFINNWMKNARALLAKMRLKTAALQDHCQELRNQLFIKSDLSGTISHLDFEKSMIKRSQLLKTLHKQIAHVAGLKGVAGKASLAMSKEQQTMLKLEEEAKQLNNETLATIKAIGKLEDEIRILDKANAKDMEALWGLRMKMEHFEAPSVDQYMEKKHELFNLEKEEKMLKRKLHILNMKFKNAQRQCGKQAKDSMEN
uniref:Cilia- and flagella-associated protein 263 n=1 Tax=Stomoxys calcitrans TaxID=35570 RepID=A0A1I8NQB0_STOCA